MGISKEDYNELKKLEESLWITETRFNMEYMERILSSDFFEFGRSGRVFTGEDILAVPSGEISAVIPLKNFEVHFLSGDAVLVTYISEDKYTGELQVCNRSSIWLKTPAGWKLKFHQGTVVST